MISISVVIFKAASIDNYCLFCLLVHKFHTVSILSVLEDVLLLLILLISERDLTYEFCCYV